MNEGACRLRNWSLVVMNRKQADECGGVRCREARRAERKKAESTRKTKGGMIGRTEWRTQTAKKTGHDYSIFLVIAASPTAIAAPAVVHIAYPLAVGGGE